MNQPNKKKTKEEIQDVGFMPDVLAAEHITTSSAAPVILYTVILCFVFLFLWASIAEIDEITRGEGKVIPSSLVQKVDHLEGGIVKAILVEEGQIVQKGQVLLRVDNTVAEARLTEGKTLYYRYLGEVARLRAQIEEKPFVLPKEVAEKSPDDAREVMDNYNQRMENMDNEIRIAQKEVEQKQQEVNELKSREIELQKQTEIINRKIEILEPLVAKNIEPEIALLDLKREASQIRGELNGMKSNILRSEAALEQSQQKLRQVPVKFRAEDWNMFRDASNKLASAQSSYITEGDRANRTEVRAPVRGIIKRLLVTTVGGVIQAGEDLVELVPLEDRLLIEVHVNPKDVAFLRPGLQASVKISAYDSSVFGDMKGEVVRISADSIVEKDSTGRENTFYKVYVRTKGSKLSKTKRELPIMPGMTATVDILTGKKTLLKYIMKPIIRSTQEALTER